MSIHSEWKLILHSRPCENPNPAQTTEQPHINTAAILAHFYRFPQNPTNQELGFCKLFNRFPSFLSSLIPLAISAIPRPSNGQVKQEVEPQSTLGFVFRFLQFLSKVCVLFFNYVLIYFLFSFCRLTQLPLYSHRPSPPRKVPFIYFIFVSF